MQRELALDQMASFFQLPRTYMRRRAPEYVLYRDLGFRRVILGGGRRDADDPDTTLPFIDGYSAMIDDLAKRSRTA